MSDHETIRWQAVKDELPDSDITVLVHTPAEDEPVWLGWYDSAADCWYAVDASRFEPGAVTAWSDMPQGPEGKGG